MKILFRAGHGSPDGDNGAVASDGTKEHDINSGVMNFLASKMDGKVPYLIAPETYDTNANYTYAKNNDCNLILFIHSNSSVNKSARGCEVYYNDEKFKGYGTSLGNYYSRAMGMTLRWVTKKACVGAMDNTDIPILLLELGFLSNSQDLQILKTQQSYMADAIMHWVLGQCYDSILECTFQENSNIYNKNNSANNFTLSAPVRIINGRSYLPLRDIAELTGKKTGYLPALKKIILY